MSSDINFSQNYNTTTFREEIDLTFPKDKFEANFKKAVESFKKSAVAPGFRKGNVPENVVLSKYMQEINNKAISLSIEESVKSLGELKPQPAEPLNIEKIEQIERGDIKFLITYISMPEVTVGDLSKIKVTKKEAKKTNEEELQNELQNIWFHFVKNIDPAIKKEDFSIEKIDAEFLEKSGLKNVYKDVNTVEDLKKQLEEYINGTYESNSWLEWEGEIQDKIIENSKYERVEGIIEKELNNRVTDYKSRFSQMGMDPEKYISENNVDIEALRSEWKPSAEKYVKLELALQKYGKDNNFLPTEEDVENEIALLEENVKNRYKDNPENLTSLIRYYWVNQKSFSDIQSKIKENSGLEEASKPKKAKK